MIHFEDLAFIKKFRAMTDKIVTRYDPKPIPERRFDWSAIDDDYEPGMPIGFGATEEEAVADLMTSHEETANPITVTRIKQR